MYCFVIDAKISVLTNTSSKRVKYWLCATFLQTASTRTQPQKRTKLHASSCWSRFSLTPTEGPTVRRLPPVNSCLQLIWSAQGFIDRIMLNINKLMIFRSHIYIYEDISHVTGRLPCCALLLLWCRSRRPCGFCIRLINGIAGSNPAEGTFSFLAYVVCCVGSGLGDELIAHSKKSCHVCLSNCMYSRHLKNEAA
jgi:hypothetical protein